MILKNKKGYGTLQEYSNAAKGECSKRELCRKVLVYRIVHDDVHLCLQSDGVPLVIIVYFTT